MRTLAIGNKRSAQVGLSLIELLVVLVIMGLVTGLVVLTAPSRTPPATTAAERLRGELTALRMRAITEGSPIGISAPGGIIRAHQYRNGAWSPGTPLPRLDQVHTDIELGEQFILPEDTRAAPVLVLEGRRLDDTPLLAPPIRLDPTGEATAANLTVRVGTGYAEIALDGDGKVRLTDD